MATEKKHIAVYLDPAVEAALVAFCEQKGLKSKKGTMFSAGVNAALAQFFGISESEPGNIRQETDNIPFRLGNTPSKPDNIPVTSSSNTLTYSSNIPVESLAVGVLPGKSEGLSDTEMESLRQELTETDRYYIELLTSSATTIGTLKKELEAAQAENQRLETGLGNSQAELAEVRSQLETERASREEIEAQLSDLKQKSATASELPEAADLLNQLKARRKKSRADLGDVEAILGLLAEENGSD
jgi:hypothetical protein